MPWFTHFDINMNNIRIVVAHILSRPGECNKQMSLLPLMYYVCFGKATGKLQLLHAGVCVAFGGLRWYIRIYVWDTDFFKMLVISCDPPEEDKHINVNIYSKIWLSQHHVWCMRVNVNQSIFYSTLSPSRFALMPINKANISPTPSLVEHLLHKLNVFAPVASKKENMLPNDRYNRFRMLINAVIGSEGWT